MKKGAYQIKPLILLMRDEDSVRFHVKNDDYFGTIATVISLIRQKLKKEKRPNDLAVQALNNLEKDLMFLQKNYRIDSK